MCTNTSIYLVVKMNFISQTVHECDRILLSGVRVKLPVVKSMLVHGCDVTSPLWSQLEPPAERYNGGTMGRRKEALELPPVQVHSTRTGEAQINNVHGQAELIG